MDYAIAHKLPGRLRLRVDKKKLYSYNTDSLENTISQFLGVKETVINLVTGSILIKHDAVISELLKALSDINLNDVPERTQPISTSLGWSYIGYQLYRFLQPISLKPFLTTMSAMPYIKRGLKSLFNFKVDIGVLDAAAICSQILQKDFKSASSLMMLLTTGDYLEQWARSRSKKSLANVISLNSSDVWIKNGDVEELVSYSSLKQDDLVIFRAGSMIVVDGIVLQGMAMVNEASMTGEPLSIVKEAYSTVHGGTVIEEGEIVVEVKQKGEDTRFQKIIELIHESESSKADVETKANEFADRIVPFNFIIAGLVYAITKNSVKASAALSVDYSCAIKLSTPLVFLSVMKEALSNSVFFKGGHSIEALSFVDTIVFDKTGTLTEASPQVQRIIAYNGFSEREVLKISACLEEHFPHPVAKAVVRHAVEHKVCHKEVHSEVKYIIAHGIATSYKDKHTVIGSRHFVHDDEEVDLSIALNDEKEAAGNGLSVLYLAQSGFLIGIILISDPIRMEAADIIAMLRVTGINNIYMLTGDNAHAAERVALELGIDHYKAEMLPNEKANIVKQLKGEGYKVAVVGDGMNDSPALSFADVGIAMKAGSDLAQQVSDITLRSDSLYSLVIARLMAQRTMARIKHNNVSAVVVNSILMLFSILGPLTPQSSVWLHNLTTLFISMKSMSRLLPESYKLPQVNICDKNK